MWTRSDLAGRFLRMLDFRFSLCLQRESVSRSICHLFLFTFCVMPLHAQDVTWTSINGDWQDSRNWSSIPALPTDSDDVVITVPSANASVTHRNDATTIRSLTLDDRLRLQSGSITVTGGVDLRRGSSITSDGEFVALGKSNANSATLSAGTEFVSAGSIHIPMLTDFATDDSISWTSNQDGSLLDLSGLETIAGPSNAFRIFTIAARRGGVIDLSAVTSMTSQNDTSLIKITAEGAKTVIDLSELGDLIGSGISEISVVDEGEIKWGQIQILDDVALTLGGKFPSSEITTVTNGLLAVENGNAPIPDLNAINNVDNSRLRAGRQSAVSGTLVLPELMAYSTRGNADWVSTETGSLLDLSSLQTINGPDSSFRILSVTAERGGGIDLRSLTQVNRRNDTSLVTITAVDPGSSIDLSSLNDLVDSGIRAVTVAENAQIRWGNLVTADAVEFRFGGTFDTSQLTTATTGLLAAENGASVAPDLSNVSNADSSSLRAGLTSTISGQLRLPGLQTYSTSDSSQWTATEAGSVLDLSALQSINGPDASSRILSITASAGGKIDLSQVTTITQRNATSLVKVTAEAPGSLIDLSAIPDLTESGITDVAVLHGAEIRLGSLVTADGVNFRLGGQLDTSSLAVATNGSISAENGEVADANLSNVTNVNNSSLKAGLAATIFGRLELPALRTYSTETSQSFTATEAGSVLDLSSLQTINGPSNALRDLTISSVRGGLIDLGNVSTVNQMEPSSRVNILASDEGSSVYLPKLDQTGGITVIDAKAKAHIQLGILQASDIDIAATGGAQIIADRITLGTNAVLKGQGITGSITNSAGRIEISESSMQISEQYFHNGGNLTIPEGKTLEVGVDYDNSQFGVGNDFQSRAGIPGDGQLQARSAGQALTGSVSDGATDKPRVSLGNVHVGNTLTGTYRIRNTGDATSLRGATKTLFTGMPPGNSLLSGKGAGGNFGPILPGATQELTVVVTPTAAGPIPEQQVMIENNFDNVANQVATFSATAYRLAEPTISPTRVDFGIVHVNDELVPIPIEVGNDAFADTYSESLDVMATSTADAIAAGSPVIGIAPQTSNSTHLTASLDTSSPGLKSGTLILHLDSNGSGTSDLGITPLRTEQVAVLGQVNEYANPVPIATGDATLERSIDDSSWLLDFGVIFQGFGPKSASLSLLNDVNFPADTLAGGWTTPESEFLFTGFANTLNLEPGNQQRGNSISIEPNVLGNFSGMVTLVTKSENESGFSLQLEAIQINIAANVVVRGDFDGNQSLAVTDIDLLTAAVSQASQERLFDVDLNGIVDSEDITFWISELKGSLLGDTDLNGAVEFADFLVISNAFGTNDNGWSGGDLDGNGVTEFADFLTLSGNFGKTANSIEIVPEPNTQDILLFAIVTLITHRRTYARFQE